jgi:hypothetical protein
MLKTLNINLKKQFIDFINASNSSRYFQNVENIEHKFFKNSLIFNASNSTRIFKMLKTLNIKTKNSLILMLIIQLLFSKC